MKNYSLRDLEKAYLKVAPKFHHLHMEIHIEMLAEVKKEMRRQRKGLVRKDGKRVHSK